MIIAMRPCSSQQQLTDLRKFFGKKKKYFIFF